MNSIRILRSINGNHRQRHHRYRSSQLRQFPTLTTGTCVGWTSSPSARHRSKQTQQSMNSPISNPIEYRTISTRSEDSYSPNNKHLPVTSLKIQLHVVRRVMDPTNNTCINQNNEDSRKKRDSAEVVKGNVVAHEEKAKKLRATKKKHASRVLVPVCSLLTQGDASSTVSSEKNEAYGDSSLDLSSVNTLISNDQDDSNNDRKGIFSATTLVDHEELDLEVALQRLVRMGQEGDDDGDSKEYLCLGTSLQKKTWLTFRLGHAGDASTLATCYRRSVQSKGNVPASGTQNIADQGKSVQHSSDSSNANETRIPATEDTSWEVRLAEGLGDEDTPPSIFALLAEVESDDKSDNPYLGAAALVSIDWECAWKVLRVELLYVANNVDAGDRACDEESNTGSQSHYVAGILKRRLWLRLAVLATMTSCQLISTAA